MICDINVTFCINSLPHWTYFIHRVYTASLTIAHNIPPCKKGKRTRAEADLSSTVSESVKDYFDNLISSMKEGFENQFKLLKDEFLAREHELQVKQENIEKALKEEKELNVKMREENKELKHQTQILNQSMAEAAQYSRKCNLKIFGLRETRRNETAVDTSHLVVDFLNAKLGVRVSIGDINVAHRLGNPEPNRYRSVIVKFVRRLTKLEVLENRWRLKGSGIVIAEDLTPANNKLFWELRESCGAKNVWTRDSKIYVNTRVGPRQIDLFNRHEVEILCHGPHDASTPHQQDRQPQPRRHRHQEQHVQPARREREPRQGPGGRPTSTPPGRPGRGRARGSPRAPRETGVGLTEPPPPGVDLEPPGAWGPPLRGFARGNARFADA